MLHAISHCTTSIFDMASGKRIGDIHALGVIDVATKAHLAIVMTNHGLVASYVHSGKQSPFPASPDASSIAPDGIHAVVIRKTVDILDQITGKSRTVATNDIPSAYGAVISSD